MIRLITPKNTTVSKVLPAKTIVTVGSGCAVGTLVRQNIATGVFEIAPDATNTNLYLAQQVVADTDVTTAPLCVRVDSGDEFLADSTANSSSAENGRRFNANATGTSITNGADVPAGLFIQTGVVGVPADRKITVKRV